MIRKRASSVVSVYDINTPLLSYIVLCNVDITLVTFKSGLNGWLVLLSRGGRYISHLWSGMRPLEVKYLPLMLTNNSNNANKSHISTLLNVWHKVNCYRFLIYNKLFRYSFWSYPTRNKFTYYEQWKLCFPFS